MTNDANNSDNLLGDLIRPEVSAWPTPKSIPGPHTASGDTEPLFLNSGEAWFPPSPIVKSAVERSLGNIHFYPDNLCQGLRQDLARYVGHGLSAANIIVGNGSDGLIDLLTKIVASPGHNVIAPAPTFWVYTHAAMLRGAETRRAGRGGVERDYALDMDAVLRAVDGNTRVIFLASPNNPTGDVVSELEIRHLMESTKCLVVVDECYHEFWGGTVAGLIAKYPRLVVLRSFSKSFALAGLRVGYALADERVIGALERVDQTFSVNTCAQAAARAALTDLEYYRTRFEETRRFRVIQASGLTSLGLRVSASHANILLVNYAGVYRGTSSLASELARRNVYVADFHDRDPLRNSFRCSVTDSRCQDRLIAALADILR